MNDKDFLFDSPAGLLYYLYQMMPPDDNEPDDRDWKYGDVWKQGSPDEPQHERDVTYVEILRTDSGKGFDDSLMLDLIAYLGSQGIRATYDTFSIGFEPAAIKTYVLKVEEGKEREGMRLLDEKLR